MPSSPTVTPGALVAPDGSVEWICLPRFDSPSVFGSLLDRRAGSFRVGPYGLFVPLSVRYVPGTMIVETTWITASGWLVIQDVLTIGPWHQSHVNEASHTRPPTDQDADHMLVRMLECIQGSVQVEAICEPMFEYGRVPAHWTMCNEEWTAAEATDDEVTVRLVADSATRDRGQPAVMHVISQEETAAERPPSRSAGAGVDGRSSDRRYLGRRARTRRQSAPDGEGTR
jgi:alpha,alpha-trehalase